jgi:hypothetical protein
VQGALSETINLEAGQLAYVTDEVQVRVTPLPVVPVSKHEKSVVSWYTALQIVPYKLTFVSDRVGECILQLETLIERDKKFQSFLNTNKGEADWFVSSVERCKNQGRTYKQRLSWRATSIWLGLGDDSKDHMLHRGLVNYCRFALKQYACFSKNAQYIPSWTERNRAKALVRRCLEMARVYVDPIFHTDLAFERWYTRVVAALAQDVDIGGPVWVEEEECVVPTASDADAKD